MRSLLTVTAICALASASVIWSPASQAATPTCFGKTATIVGTSGNDTIVFGPGDVVYAGAGNDIISSDESQTFTAYICGGPGDDVIRGGRGVDYIHGDDGNDSINGGYGGADTLLGDLGDDHINDFDDFDYPDSADPGIDIIRGGAGNDVLNTTCGSDKVYGDTGQDTITDYTRAKSYLYGGADNDKIDATQNIVGTNPFAPDYVSGDKGYDAAVVNHNDIVTSSTEAKTYR